MTKPSATARRSRWRIAIIKWTLASRESSVVGRSHWLSLIARGRFERRELKQKGVDVVQKQSRPAWYRRRAVELFPGLKLTHYPSVQHLCTVAPSAATSPTCSLRKS